MLTWTVRVMQGRYHFWRVVEKDSDGGVTNAPCVFLSWEWVFQGVSQRGISTECWVRQLLAGLLRFLVLRLEARILEEEQGGRDTLTSLLFFLT